jgi:hypothetical protein
VIPIEDPTGYEVGSCSGTDSKPQSKIWYNDGSYWCLLDSPKGNRILQLSGNRWVPLQTPNAILGSHEGRADVVWDGARLIVLLYDKQPSLFEFTYDKSRRGYSRQQGFPLPLAIAPGSETMVLDEDSHGRLWATYVSDHKVYVTHSSTDHLHWDLPGQVLCDSLTNDDISTIIAYGAAGGAKRDSGRRRGGASSPVGGSIGVFWSDQRSWEFGFRARSDADAPDAWGPLEVVDQGKGCADDHVHLTADQSGRVYAVTKNAKHKLAAHMRTPDGAWSSVRDILSDGDATRPIVMTAEADSQLVLLYVRWHEGSNVIDYRTSRLGDIHFGEPRMLISVPGLDLNDPAGMKQPLPKGSVIAIADGGGMAWWNGWGAPSYKSKAALQEGPSLAAHPTFVCETAALALAFDEGGGSVAADASPHGARAVLGGPWADDLSEPAWTHGVSGSALRFDGSTDFAVLEPAPQLDVSGSMTVETWFRRARTGVREALLCKGTAGFRNYMLVVQKKDYLEFRWELPDGKDRGAGGKVTIADTLWHHVAGVYDQAQHQSRIYVDGKLDGAEPDSGTAVVNLDPLIIGMRLVGKGPREWFAGDIDQVRITPGVRYTADFEPARTFETQDSARLFLDWTPRYEARLETAAYDVFRSVGSGPRVRLNVATLEDATFFDPQPPAGKLRYEIQRHGGGELSRLRLTVVWPPASAHGLVDAPRSAP